MDFSEISALEIVPLREAFKFEDRSFTPWLEQNIESLGERLGLHLSLAQREKSVGDFKVDIFCEGPDGQLVIIENQLERSDHGHLGQLITYLVNLDASIAIWVTPEPRVEHLKAIEWLNEITPENISFYLVRVEAIRIGNSPYAPLFNKLAGPDRTQKQIGASKKEWAEKDIVLKEFWQEFIDRSRPITPLLLNRSSTKEHWLDVGAGLAGIYYSCVVMKRGGRIELIIDFGKESAEKNRIFFSALKEETTGIEGALGSQLTWDEKILTRRCKVSMEIPIGSINDKDSWPALQQKMLDSLVLFDRVLKPKVSAIARAV